MQAQNFGLWNLMNKLVCFGGIRVQVCHGVIEKEGDRFCEDNVAKA